MIKIKVFADGVTEVFSGEGRLLSEILRENGIGRDLPCGGNGTCLRCGVKASGGLSKPSEAELRAFNETELAEGYRLACQTRVLGDTAVYIESGEIFENILLSGRMPDFVADPIYNKYGIAVDIGTTTVSAQLYNRDGLRHSVSMKNPQAIFGADVITRIEKAICGYAEELDANVRGAISALARALAGRENIHTDDIDMAVITGNTAMLYLLTGQNPQALSRAPFEADRLFGEYAKLGIMSLKNARFYLPRCISAFVGADITTAILASGMCRGKGTSLLVDIGTNGEIALWHKKMLYCCSTAAGPAFEGVGLHCGSYAVNGAVDKVRLENGQIKISSIGAAAPSGICGSGIIDALAVMLDAGIMDETGALQDDGHDFTAYITEMDSQPAFRLCDGIAVTARDVRSIQLAKGSLRAGMETLLHSAGVEKDEIENLYIAGGFGNYMNMHSAATIGLLPKELAPKAVAIGNAAQSGAAMLLQNKAFAGEAIKIAECAETVLLSANPLFMDYYMEHMMF